jgi:type IV secretory pathway TrbL component
VSMYFDQRWTSRACHVVDYLRQHHWKLIMALISLAGLWWGVRGRP